MDQSSCCRTCLRLPLSLLSDVNAFRSKYLYVPEVDELLKAHKPLLLGIFALYRSRHRTRGLTVDGWLELMEESRLLSDHIGSIGLNGRECKLVFLWSRMLKVDPHTVPKGWAQGAITLVEFMEAIARTADLISFPSVRFTAQSAQRSRPFSASVLVPLSCLPKKEFSERKRKTTR